MKTSEIVKLAIYEKFKTDLELDESFLDQHIKQADFDDLIVDLNNRFDTAFTELTIDITPSDLIKHVKKLVD